jgi:hypothetical protein
LSFSAPLGSKCPPPRRGKEDGGPDILKSRRHASFHKNYGARGGNLTRKEKHVSFCVSPRLVGRACIEHERKRAYGAPPQRVVLCETFLRFRWKRHLPQKRQENCHNALRHYKYMLQKRKTVVNFFGYGTKKRSHGVPQCLMCSYDFGEGRGRANADDTLCKIIRPPRGQSDKCGIIFFSENRKRSSTDHVLPPLAK